MPEPDFDVAEAQWWFAVAMNNEAWDLLDQSERTTAESERMCHAAHASCRHWLEAGSTLQHQRTLVLVANTHAAVGDAATGLAEQLADDLADFDHAFTLDAQARAHAAAGRLDEARSCRQQSETAGAAIDDDDRRVFVDWSRSGEWHGLA